MDSLFHFTLGKMGKTYFLLRHASPGIVLRGSLYNGHVQEKPEQGYSTVLLTILFQITLTPSQHQPRQQMHSFTSCQTSLLCLHIRCMSLDDKISNPPNPKKILQGREGGKMKNKTVPIIVIMMVLTNSIRVMDQLKSHCFSKSLSIS